MSLLSRLILPAFRLGGSLAAGDPPSEAEMLEVHKAASLDTAKGQA